MSLTTSVISTRMRKLIGSRFSYLKQTWMLLDVLEAEGKLILSSSDGFSPIQADQFGQPTRRVPETLAIDISSHDDPTEYSEELMVLLAGKL